MVHDDSILPGHDRFYQRAKVLVLHSSLSTELIVREPGPVRSEGHALVLEVALAALVADGAVQGVVDQQELHDALPRLASEV